MEVRFFQLAAYTFLTRNEGKMYLLFALILYLKAKGIEVGWEWYLLAFLEIFDTKRIRIIK